MRANQRSTAAQGDDRAPAPFDLLGTRQSWAARAERLYRRALTLRILVLAFSSVAVLPDSALVAGLPDSAYAIVTSAAGLGATAAFLVLKSTRLVESMNQANDNVAYLDSRRAELLVADGLTRRRIYDEIETELASRAAAHRRGVLDDLGGPGVLGQREPM
jgi:hypothetical protein